MGEGGGAGGVWLFFFFNDTATTEIYTLSLHDALPISSPNFFENLAEPTGGGIVPSSPQMDPTRRLNLLGEC